jgi:hypothetical protein
MAARIDLTSSNPTLNELLEQAASWSDLQVSSLSTDQVAILNLKRVLETQRGVERPQNECFICATGA